MQSMGVKMFGIKADEVREIVREELEEVLNDGESSTNKLRALEKDIKRLTGEKEELEFKKKMEEKEITHLVKMKEEKINIETQKKEIELKKDFQVKEMALQKEYFDKVMAAVKDGQKKMEDIYTKILERLPNVNMEITRSK